MRRRTGEEEEEEGTELKTKTPHVNVGNYTKALRGQETRFTLDSHMLTSDSFFSLQTQHSHRETQNTTKTEEGKNPKQRSKFLCGLYLSCDELGDTAALFIK